MQQSLLTELIESFCCLPGVGKKSAQRMAYHLLDKNRQGGLILSASLHQSMQDIGNCNRCRDYTESDECQICQNDRRDESLLCVVESPSDVLAIESTANFHGKFFVLLGQLSPLDGVGPNEIGMPLLVSRLKEGIITEVIVATSSTIEGETTANYISQIANQELGEKIKVTRLAQGVPVGGELEYLDQSTLALSLANRKLI